MEVHYETFLKSIILDSHKSHHNIEGNKNTTKMSLYVKTKKYNMKHLVTGTRIVEIRVVGKMLCRI